MSFGRMVKGGETCPRGHEFENMPRMPKSFLTFI